MRDWDWEEKDFIFYIKIKKNTPYNIIILHAHNFVDLNERNKTSTTSNVM